MASSFGRRDFISFSVARRRRGRWRRMRSSPSGYGLLGGLSADDPEARTRTTAFVQGLQEMGWTVDRNARIDYRLSNPQPAAATYMHLWSPNAAGLFANQLVFLVYLFRGQR